MERDDVLRLLGRIAATGLGDELVLGGSSGIYAVSDRLPALTEDADFLVDADRVAGDESRFLDELATAGFRHQPESPTFLSDDGLSFDLIGYSRDAGHDRLGGGDRLRVMIFGDLGTLIAAPAALVRHRSGGLALTAAALAAAKLLTIRQEKGSKDKLQALLLIAENAGDAQFRAQLREILGRFERDRVDDAVGDAYLAILALGRDLERHDPQADLYLTLRADAQRGLEELHRIVSGEPP